MPFTHISVRLRLGLDTARRVCEALHWYDNLGRPKLMSCRVGLLRLHRGGLIELPPPRNGNGNGNGRGLRQHPLDWTDPRPVTGSVGELSGLRLERVADKGSSQRWNALIDRWHYRGYTRLARGATALPDPLRSGPVRGAWLRRGGLEGGRHATGGSVGSPARARRIWGGCSTTPGFCCCHESARRISPPRFLLWPHAPFPNIGNVACCKKGR
jgi:hypothetical protein